MSKAEQVRCYMWESKSRNDLGDESPKATLGNCPMLLRTLQRGELTGGKGWPRSCLDLPAAFLERLDAPERVSRDEKPREAMPALLRQLEQRILRHEDPKSAGFRDLVLKVGKRVCESSQQRSVFVDCCGDVLLVRLLQQLVPSEGGPLTAPSVINECVQILARRPLPSVRSWAHPFTTLPPQLSHLAAHPTHRPPAHAPGCAPDSCAPALRRSWRSARCTWPRRCACSGRSSSSSSVSWPSAARSTPHPH